MNRQNDKRRDFLKCGTGVFGALLLNGFPGSRTRAHQSAGTMESRITSGLKPFIDMAEISGVVAVTGTSGGIDALVSLGKASIATGVEMTPETRFRIASMTKPLTAVTVMMLAEEGRLKPGDPLEVHIPGFKGIKVVVKSKDNKIEIQNLKNPLLVKHLLTHTSGIPNYPKVLGDVYGTRKPDLKGCVAELARVPLDFEPGSRWSYCNPGIDTLGRLVEVKSGQTYSDFVAQRILNPLGMKSTRFFPSPEDRAKVAAIYDRKDGALFEVPKNWGTPPEDAVNPVPAGGLWSTGPDMAKVCVHFLGLLRGSQKEGIISSESLKEMTRIHTGSLKAGFVDGTGFGYGWAVVKKPVGITEKLSPGTFGHGGAFGTQYWIDPVKDRFVILMIQRQGLANGDASPMRKALQEAAFA